MDSGIHLKTFLEVKDTADNPVQLFSEDWQEKIDTFISDYLTKNKLLVTNLTRQQKQAAIQELSKHGVFFYKNAPTYVAAKLKLSRATIYNHLKILRAIS